ncbi:hypothetical protein EFP20_17550 [Burkholderia glumae]|nr:hypothetical protein CEQ24_000705 [Burkholderia glumae]QHP92831.1 hypothetical protein EXE55_17780 [Burkholderia glumae]UVS94178.1 hypothetical protein EFP17_23665 [Burkholderia glumae]UVT03244.1 hypothetical protein EFP20_17550 [Burkholderia glumae]
MQRDAVRAATRGAPPGMGDASPSWRLPALARGAYFRPSGGNVQEATHPPTTELYRGHEIQVGARRNARGGWLPEIAMYRDGRPVDCPMPEPGGPQWQTAAEAVRDGLERGRYVIDHGEAFE